MKNNIIKKLIGIELILLPVLDILRTTNFKNIEIFEISIIELVNIVLIGISFLLTLPKCSKKQIFGLFGYFALLGIYLYLHIKNILVFDTNIYKQANPNIIIETFYICRVYILPLLLLFTLIKNKDIFNKEFYIKTAKRVIAFISISIIVLNILKLSYISYSSTHEHIAYNMFDYFLYTGDYRNLSSRGWFDSANELSAILFMLLPINIYMLYKERKKTNLILYMCQFFAMILLGTRTSAIGALLISLLAIFVYIFLKFINKESSRISTYKPFILATLICTAYLAISPFTMSRINENNYNFAIVDKTAYSSLENIDKQNLEELFKKYSSEYLINPLFLKKYPVSNDPEFWIKMAKRDKALNNNSRILKIDILNRFIERNNNSNDKYLGIGYTINFIDAERDYVFQYYLFGIFGLIILIGPYFALLLYLLIKILTNLKNNINFKTIMMIISPLLGLVIAYYSGHVFGWVSPMMYLVMVLGLLTYIVLENRKGIKNER